jgi:tetratricopeptide (TPR) repeat protein
MLGQYEPSLFIFQEALKLYEQCNSRDAEVAECWFNLGNALLNLNREREALDAFAKTTDYDVDQKLGIKVLYAEGRAYENIKNSQAITKFSQCAVLIGDNKSH